MNLPEDPQRLVLRTSWPLAHILGPDIELRYGVPCLIAAIGFLLTLIWLLQANGVPRSPIYWAVLSIGVAAILFAFYATRQYDGTTLVVSNGIVVLQKWFSPPHEVVIADIARIVLCSVRYEVNRADQFPHPAAFMFGADGKCLMSLYIGRWRQADVQRLFDRLGVAPEGSFTHLVWYSELSQLFPHAFDKAA